MPSSLIEIPTLEEIIKRFNLSVDSTEASSWCRENRLQLITDPDGKSYLCGNDLGQFLAHFKYRGDRLIETDYSLIGSNPELIDYIRFHNLIDVFCWLLKNRYLPKEDIRRRRFNLVKLTDSFLTETAYSLNKVKRLVGKDPSPERFIFHLNKGWYNELARSYPLTKQSSNLTPKEDSTGRSASWNITQSYYACYEYLNALVFTNTSNLDTKQHRKSSAYLVKNLFEKLSALLIRYPFNLVSPLSHSLDSLRKADKDFWKKAKYTHYIRRPIKYGLSEDNFAQVNNDIYQMESDFVATLGTLQTKTSQDAPCTIIDLLYEMRVWANYLGIETIISLQDGYYLAYMYKNLQAICHFYGLFAEIMSLAFLGEQKTVELLERIATKHILPQSHYQENIYEIPFFLRFRLYQKHGLISTRQKMEFLTPPSADPLSKL